ncbi:hypothetical protein BDQ17DRAFT_1421802 [Cyathus striatus]|nr:hypothetical protein BDQ17DRAFT_1421802 [Cyathus striatus]
MFFHEHQEHPTRAELAFSFARADSLARNLPISNVSVVIYSMPGVTAPPRLPASEIPELTSDIETNTPHLHCVTREESPFIYALIQEHIGIWNQLITHPFPRQLADGSASLDQFRYYMIQDILYLQGSVRDKMMTAVQADFSMLEAVAQKLPSSIKYCHDVKDICIYDLGVPEEVIDCTEESGIVKESRNFHFSVARNDDWFALHIAMLPCILGYYEIIASIISNPKSAKNTPYYSSWVARNADVSYSKAYIKFANDNLGRFQTPKAIVRWRELFEEACKLEIKFFNVGRELPSPYAIVPSGIYQIINFWNGYALESTTTNNPAQESDKQQNLSGTAAAHRFVYTAPVKGKDSQKWILEPTYNGYTVKNMVTEEYAAVAASSMGQFAVASSKDKAYWWINTVNTKFECLPVKYQFFVASSVQRTLAVSEDSACIGVFDNTQFDSQKHSRPCCDESHGHVPDVDS